MSQEKGSAVQVHLYAAARAVSTEIIQAIPGSIESILAQCIDQYPALARVVPQCSFLVNEVATTDLSTDVAAGSQLDVLPRFAGGA